MQKISPKFRSEFGIEFKFRFRILVRAFNLLRGKLGQKHDKMVYKMVIKVKLERSWEQERMWQPEAFILEY